MRVTAHVQCDAPLTAAAARGALRAVLASPDAAGSALGYEVLEIEAVPAVTDSDSEALAEALATAWAARASAEEAQAAAAAQAEAAAAEAARARADAEEARGQARTAEEEGRAEVARWRQEAAAEAARAAALRADAEVPPASIPRPHPRLRPFPRPCLEDFSLRVPVD